MVEAGPSPEIERFLQLNSPEASAGPSDPEMVFWVLHRNGAGEVDAVAGGKRWQSGTPAIVSVAVGLDSRRQGLGEAVTQVAASEWFARGASAVHLGVRGSNTGAQALYRKIGFDLLLDFTSIRLSG